MAVCVTKGSHSVTVSLAPHTGCEGAVVEESLMATLSVTCIKAATFSYVHEQDTQRVCFDVQPTPPLMQMYVHTYPVLGDIQHIS